MNKLKLFYGELLNNDAGAVYEGIRLNRFLEVKTNSSRIVTLFDFHNISEGFSLGSFYNFLIIPLAFNDLSNFQDEQILRFKLTLVNWEPPNPNYFLAYSQDIYHMSNLHIVETQSLGKILLSSEDINKSIKDINGDYIIGYSRLDLYAVMLPNESVKEI